MEYTQEMNLQSESGYCMPFNDRKEEVVLTRAYGKQEDGSFNHGIDLAADRYVLRAVADGIVTAIGTDREHGLYQTTRYGKYDVTYGGIRNAMVAFGKRVKAGSILSISGSTLHLEVRYDGTEIDPVEFLKMLFGNMKMSGTDSGMPDFETLDMDIPTDYDDNMEEIEDLMARFYPEYLMEVAGGLYSVPDKTEQSLRNIFSLSAARSYFYDAIPSMANPLGLTERSVPIAAKVQNLLIGDFLNYLALRHRIFLSAMDEAGKKSYDEAVATAGIIDPLADLEIDVRSFDIQRLVTVYPDRSGIRWWAKAWFNGSEDGEAAVEIERECAIQFLLDRIDKERRNISRNRWKSITTPSNRQRKTY